MLLWRHLSPDLVHRRCSHSHHTYPSEDLQGLEGDQGTAAEQGQAAHRGRGWRVVRCSRKASAKAPRPHRPALRAGLALTHFP